MTRVLPEVPAYPMARDGRCPFDPPPPLGGLREDAPVSRVRLWDGSTPWLVTRYADVRAVLADPRVSSDSDLPGFPHTTPGVAARRGRVKSFITMDDPDHARHRRLLTSDFTVRRMEALRPRVQGIVDGLIDDMLAGPRPVDLVQAFSLPLPSLVICELLGVPYADRDFFHRASRTIIARDATPEDAVGATDDLLAYLGDLVDRKDAEPTDDLLGRLTAEQLRTGAMSRAEIASMGLLLLVAGHETTANMITLGTAALLREPGQLALLRDGGDPAVVANAVEELLRYLTIVHLGRRRVALADLEVGGVLIRAGEGIIAATDAANRDPGAFADPDALDITRKARHHVAFGYGVHQCLGQPLARVEMQVAFETLYRRLPGLALAEPVERLPFKHDMIIYGVHELPVTW
ncbi:putative cytochrome P450 hydroxylase [Actinokineospora spheciospongiae]|uniref:Putative cytochrome P450 hydroxylase n=1 Tax=Actinokineospora spheciospongiae TaxID=909613 RepID=W7J4V5_9PSEU|nr:cytochrome P450 [Actinokineospora spheciospongiae]EWC61134.1 putative cytochrome P450 hydroxylase [Actinokineospora spheciospongiae]